MKSKLYFTGFFSFALLFLISCSTDDILNNEYDDEEDEEEEYIDPGDDELIPNSQDVNFENAIYIAFGSDGVTIDNQFENLGITITNTGGHVTINSSNTEDEVNYILSGITENGSLKIYGGLRFGLVLNGVGITNPNGAAINNQCSKKVTVTVVDNTTNRLIDGVEYDYIDGEDMKGTFFSEGQLNFYGSGTLEIRGKNKHAICVDDYFRMYEGNIIIKEAASDAIHANDYIRVDAGTINTRSVGEGLDCEKGYVQINGGTLNLITTGKKGHGIKSYETTTINGGDITIKVSGVASKAINSTGDITIKNGTLNLTTTGSAYYDEDEKDTSSAAGIKGGANAVIDNGTIIVKSTGKGGKGINITGTLTINDGDIQVTTTGDQFVYQRYDTAAKAIKSTGDLTVNGGTIKVSTSKTEAEGMESKARLYINGGDIEIQAYDDCINASNHIEITGGNIYALSESNDAIDSNGTLTISGGVIVAVGAGSPEAGFDCDNSRFTITGGLMVGVGGSTSTPTASACTQYSVIFNTSSSNVEIIHIQSSDGTGVMTFKLPKKYNRTCMLFSSPSLAKSTQYTIYTGGSISGGTDFYGLYTDGNYKSGSSAGSFTTSSMVSTVGTSSGGGGGGGWGPR